MITTPTASASAANAAAATEIAGAGIASGDVARVDTASGEATTGEAADSNASQRVAVAARAIANEIGRGGSLAGDGQSVAPSAPETKSAVADPGDGIDAQKSDVSSPDAHIPSSRGNGHADAADATAEDTGPAGETTSPAVATTADDLQHIRGVGPVVAAQLATLGITTFAQIAQWTRADIARLETVLRFKGRIDREKWISQAKTLARNAQAVAAKETAKAKRGKRQPSPGGED